MGSDSKSAEEDTSVHYSYGIVVEDSRNVFGWKFVGCIADEKARLSNSSVSNDNAPRS